MNTSDQKNARRAKSHRLRSPDPDLEFMREITPTRDDLRVPAMSTMAWRYDYPLDFEDGGTT